MTTNNSNPPIFADVGILALIYHEWSLVWMTPHHVLTRLARYFHVLWSEPPHGLKDFRKSVEKRRVFADNGDFSAPPGFHMYVPEPWYPAIHHSDRMRRFTFEQRLKHAVRRLQREGCRKLVLYLWHPQFEPALFCPNFDLKLYHIDDEYSFSPTPSPPDPRELRVLASVDQVFVVSPALLERKGGINPHTAFMPEGVDYRLYATPTAEPDDLRRIPRPRIGYTGNLKRQLDWPLLRELAMRRRDWQFVFVGPVNPEHGIEGFISEMSQWGNVHFLGPKSVTALASYPQHFDVSIMPYCVDAYTNNIYPLKLHEYLASGRPIVSSPIRSLHEFSDVVTLAETADDWLRALAAALQPAASYPELVAIRQKIAREHDWETLIDALARTICERLGPEYAEQFAKAKPSDGSVTVATSGQRV